jgi:hypothetical protein
VAKLETGTRAKHVRVAVAAAPASVRGNATVAGDSSPNLFQVLLASLQ